MFEAALKFNPDMVDAWVALSDLYFQTGKKEDALRTLEEAIERVGEHKKISLRIEELKKAGVKTNR
jgi:cytochrome c-type biogenesis protein CcmH/NrfG